MELTVEQRHEIEELIGRMTCRQDFMCYTSNFKSLCRAQDIGMDMFIKCLEDRSFGCEYSVNFGHSYLCKCPIRIHICKRFEKTKPLLESDPSK